MRTRQPATAIDVQPHLDDLKDSLEGLDGLVAAWIYGSYGTPSQTPLSDVDVALLFLPGRLPPAADDWRLEQRISTILGEDDVSVVVLNRAPVLFQLRVLATGRRLVCRDPEALADFLERVLGEHADYIVDHRRFSEEYDRALVERYG